MPQNAYVLTDADKELLNALVLDLATELDLHYECEDLPALSTSFTNIKGAVALLQRAGCRPHGDILKILARYNRTNQ